MTIHDTDVREAIVAQEQRSPFAQILRELLDDTGVLTREEWARTLGVTRQAISQWVTDKTIPRPHVLQGILDFFADARGQKREIVGRFNDMARANSVEVSPHAERFGRTVGDYLLEPLMRGFFRSFNPLPAVYKAEVLYRAAELCHNFARMKEWDEAGKVRPHPVEQLLSALHGVPEERRQQVIANMLSCLSDEEKAPWALAGLLPPDELHTYMDPATYLHSGSFYQCVPDRSRPDPDFCGLLHDVRSEEQMDWDLLVQSLSSVGNDPPTIERLISSLHGFLALHGCRGLCKWYTRTIEAGGEALPGDFATLAAGLRYHFVAPGALGERDGYAILVGHQLRARDRPLTPDELLHIARLTDTIDGALVAEALHNIWGLRERLLVVDPQIDQPWAVACAPRMLDVAPSDSFVLFTEADQVVLGGKELESAAVLLMQIEEQAVQQASPARRR